MPKDVGQTGMFRVNWKTFKESFPAPLILICTTDLSFHFLSLYFALYRVFFVARDPQTSSNAPPEQKLLGYVTDMINHVTADPALVKVDALHAEEPRVFKNPNTLLKTLKLLSSYRIRY